MILKNLFVDKLIGAVCAACFLAAITGMVTSWSSPVIPKLQNNSADNPFDQPVTQFQSSWMTSLLTLGACMGCGVFGYIAHTLGRRFATCALGIPMTLSYTLMVVFPKIKIFYIARFLMGLSLGGAQVTSMAYNCEITNKFNRGIIMTFISMMVSMGTLFTYCVGPWVSVTKFNLILGIFPIVTTVLALTFCLETPYFYLMKNEEELAKMSLRAYRGSMVNLEKEILEIKDDIEKQQAVNLLEVLKTKAFLKSFVIATMLLIFQQLTGITGILMYSQSIFDVTGSNLSPAVCSIILGALQVVSGGVAPLIADKFNRKSLLIASSTGMILSETTLGTYCIIEDSGIDVSFYKFVPVSTLCLFIFSYNFGVGPLCWIIGSEVYSTRIKTIAMPFSIFTYHITGFFLTLYFNTFVDNLGIGKVFLIFAGCGVLCILFVQFYVIETKCKTLEEIQNILKK